MGRLDGLVQHIQRGRPIGAIPFLNPLLDSASRMRENEIRRGRVRVISIRASNRGPACRVQLQQVQGMAKRPTAHTMARNGGTVFFLKNGSPGPSHRDQYPSWRRNWLQYSTANAQQATQDSIRIGWLMAQFLLRVWFRDEHERSIILHRLHP